MLAYFPGVLESVGTEGRDTYIKSFVHAIRSELGYFLCFGSRDV